MGAAVPYIYLAVAAIGTGVAIDQNKKSTAAQQVQIDLAKRQENAAALDREVQRKRRINALIGSQAAAAAASGVANAGSFANISVSDAKLDTEDATVDSVNSATRIDALNRNRASIGSAGSARNYSILMNGIQSGASAFAPSKSGSP